MTNKPSSAAHLDRAKIAPVLGRTPSGIFILTASDAAGKETGMLASWVQQASFEPPMVSVAINNDRYLRAWLKEAPQLALSLVGESQSHLLKHFARGFAPGEPAFEGIETERGVTGLPVLSGAIGHLEGRIVDSMPAGDHVLFLLEILYAGSGDALTVEGPMIHIRKNGFSY